jgi:hypothetical protein
VLRSLRMSRTFAHQQCQRNLVVLWSSTTYVTTHTQSVANQPAILYTRVHVCASVADGHLLMLLLLLLWLHVQSSRMCQGGCLFKSRALVASTCRCTECR